MPTFVSQGVASPLPDNASDADLIEAWRLGDESAAAELVRRHARPVARFLSAAGAGDDVDDLVQETFFRAFDRIDTFRGGASFRTWVMTIGSNQLKDLRRRTRRRPVVPLETDQIADHHRDPQHLMAMRDLEAKLAEGVQGLPRMQRDVFLLRAQQGLAYEEIATALGTTVGAARVHYHQATKRLKAMLEDTP
ncbi:MAG TPA: RNA polymerase sigma factor [Gemmatimonadales bacterium]|jgi:RNA polymerase sigma-70 factor (ECF subfamily)